MLTGEPCDERLMERVARGDERALETLMRRHHAALAAFIARGTDADVEDVYQETWLKVVRGAGGFDPARGFRPWLYRIARNACRDAHRRRAARPATVALEAAAAVTAGGTDDQADEQRALALECLAALATADREVLELRFYAGLTETETAAALGIPEGTVKSRTHNAVERLKKIVERSQADG